MSECNSSCYGSNRGQRIVRARKRNDESQLARVCTVVNGNLLGAAIDGDYIANLVLGLLHSKETSVVENHARDFLAGVHLDHAVALCGQRPSAIEVLSRFVRSRLEINTCNRFGVAALQRKILTSCPPGFARAVNVVPNVLNTLIRLLAVREGDKEASVDILTTAGEASLGGVCLSCE